MGGDPTLPACAVLHSTLHTIGRAVQYLQRHASNRPGSVNLRAHSSVPWFRYSIWYLSSAYEARTYLHRCHRATANVSEELWHS